MVMSRLSRLGTMRGYWDDDGGGRGAVENSDRRRFLLPKLVGCGSALDVGLEVGLGYSSCVQVDDGANREVSWGLWLVPEIFGEGGVAQAAEEYWR